MSAEAQGLRRPCRSCPAGLRWGEEGKEQCRQKFWQLIAHLVSCQRPPKVLEHQEGLLFCHSGQREIGRMRSEYPYREGSGIRKLVNVSVATAGWELCKSGENF